MAGMRAAFVLATILCLALPQLSWGAIDAASPSTSSLSLGSPTVASQIARTVAKADPSFSVASAIASDTPFLVLPLTPFDLIPFEATHPPNVNVAVPPLAPRPPPLH
jgi:hypothetical protein